MEKPLIAELRDESLVSYEFRNTINKFVRKRKQNKIEMKEENCEIRLT